MPDDVMTRRLIQLQGITAMRTHTALLGEHVGFLAGREIPDRISVRWRYGPTTGWHIRTGVVH